MSQTVAEVLIGVLEQTGVKQIFGLIGDSLNPLADALRRSHIEWIGVRHEEGAALAAAGHATHTGRLGVCCGTTGPGSTHLVAGLYEASRDHAPVLALSGDMPRKMQGIDFFQTTKPDLLFRDVSLYTETITSPDQAPGVIHQAMAAAYAGRGVAHEKVLRPAIIKILDNPLTAAKLCDALLAAQALQHDTDLLFGREFPPRHAADVLHDLFRRFLHRPGFLSHLRSLKGYDEPEILPSSTRPICLMGAGVGHLKRLFETERG